MSAEDFIQQCQAIGVDVSRETAARVGVHLDLVAKWQRTVNLVGPSTLADPWTAHALDSAQLMAAVPARVGRHVDLGSGAGFPGLVLALLGVAGRTVLVEADKRKAAFLREAIRLTEAPAEVAAVRAEALAAAGPPPADLITARALAPLTGLLDLAYPLSGPHAHYIFPKGQHVDDELTEASKSWTFTVVKRFHGHADPRTTVLSLDNVTLRPT